MKKIITLLIIVTLLFSLCVTGANAKSTSKAKSDTAVSLKFTSSIESKKCSVKSIKASKSGKYILFSMDYISDVKRNYSVFNPPSGSLFKITDTGGLPAGKHNKKFKVESAKVCKTDTITISLYRSNSNEKNFVYIDTAQLASLINGGQAKSPTNPKQQGPNQNVSPLENKGGEFDKVSFDLSINYRSSFDSDKCKVTCLMAGKAGKYIAFSMDYESDVQRNYHVFDPPSGSIFTVTDTAGLPAGKHNKKFKVEIAKLSKVDTVTITFFRYGFNENNFISFDAAQLNSLINGDNPDYANTSAQKDQSQGLPANSSMEKSDELESVSFDVSVAFTNFKQRSECTVTSLKAGNMGKYIVFSMDYKSDVKRNYSFYDSPSASVIMVTDSEGLPAGKHNKKFKIDADKLSKVTAITMKFFTSNSTEDYYIIFPTGQLISLMSEEQRNHLINLETKAPINEKDYSEFDNVSFDVLLSCNSMMESHDCKVTSLKAGKLGEYVAFSMDYESEVNRGYSIYNPPGGNIFMVADFEGLPAGKHNVKFKVEASKLRQVEDISIKLFTKVGESNYISFRSSQLGSLFN
jgi:translation elongation factor P/translation initiation factor 5A